MKNDRQLRHPRAWELRLGTGSMAVMLFAGSVAFGLIVHDGSIAVVGVCLAGSGMSLAALAMRDGSLLPRARPLEVWEARALSFVILLAMVQCGALVVDDIATHEHPATPLLVTGIAVGVLTGGLALWSLIRG